jgi:Zn-dependent protease
VRTILGLTFALNFVIGTVNILPLPFFDGYRLLELNVKNKMVVKAVMSLVLVAFLVNLLPNLFVR